MAAGKSYGNAFYQYFSGYTATLALVTSGLSYGWPSPSLPILLDKSSGFSISEETGYWLANMPLFGTVLGSLSAPLLVDNIGRQKTIRLCAFPYLLSWIMIAFSRNVELILVARFIGGISDGWTFSSVPIYIGEITEPRIRGLLGSTVPVASIFGMLLINIIGSYCSLTQTALIACALPIALIIGSIMMPESPYFLFMKGKSEEAKKNLQTLRGHLDVDLEVIRIETAVKEDMSKKSNPTSLFLVRSNRKALLMLLLLRISQEFSGDSTIVFYNQNIFKEAGSDFSENVASILYFSTELIVTAIGSGIVDKTGRRPLLIFSSIGSSLALLVIGIYFCVRTDSTNLSIIPIIALFTFVICFSSGLKTVPFVIVGEIYPQDVKAAAFCIGDIFATILVTSASKFFQVTRDVFGMHVPFICFGIICAITLVPIVVYVPETKGKTLEEIQEYFRGRKSQQEFIDQN